MKKLENQIVIQPLNKCQKVEEPIQEKKQLSNSAGNQESTEQKTIKEKIIHLAGDVDNTPNNIKPKKSLDKQDKNNSDSDGFSIEKSEPRSREVSETITIPTEIDNRKQSDDQFILVSQA